MIKHYAFPGAWGLPSLSPFCAKIDAYLRMRTLPFELLPSDSRKSPKGKLPVIRVEGQLIADSQAIIRYLEKTYDKPTHSEPLDRGQDAAEAARAHVLRRTMEEALYFAMVYARWVDPAGWAIFSPTLRPMLPNVIGPLILPMVRRSVIKANVAQGTGRHSADEVYAMAREDLDVISELVADGPYALGETMRSVDATVYGFLSTILFGQEGPLQDHLAALPALVSYCERMRAKYYKD